MPRISAQVTYRNPPRRMKTGERRRVSVNVRNTGDEDWRRGEYVLVPVEGARNRVDRWVRRPVAIGGLAHGRTTTLRFEITAPRRAKRYDYQWQVKRVRARFVPRPSARSRVVVE